MGVAIKRHDTDLRNRRKRLWTKTEDGSAWFEVLSKNEISVERFKEFVFELPPGAKVVPKPSMVHHTPKELQQLQSMKDDFDRLFGSENTNARQAVMAIMDHPTLNMHQKMKRHWALRKQFKSAIIDARGGRGEFMKATPQAVHEQRQKDYSLWGRQVRKEVFGKNHPSAMSVKDKMRSFLSGLDKIAQEDGLEAETRESRLLFQAIADHEFLTDEEKDQFFARCDLSNLMEPQKDAVDILNLARMRAQADRYRDQTSVPMNKVVYHEPGRMRVEAETRSPVIDEAMDDLIQWLKDTPEPKLQANDHSRLHKLVECVQNVLEKKLSRGLLQPFVVKHNWLGAFGRDLGDVQADELRLPFPASAFEFRVSGRAVTVICTEQDHGVVFQYFVEAKNGFWCAFSDEEGTFPVMRMVKKQIEAICVMLDAKIAETEPVKQPEKLQKKRRQTGKGPLFDYYVIDLSKHHRSNAGRKGEATGIRQRCHLRRGHWVHADERPKVEVMRKTEDRRWQQTADGQWRTWVNWYMAGDPDLGFVEKEYKL